MSKAAWYSLIVLLSSVLACIFSPGDSLLATPAKVVVACSALSFFIALALGRRIKFDPLLPG